MLTAPKQMTVDLTNQCNLRCAYCSFFDREAESCVGDTDTATWSRFFSDAGDCGVFVMNLRGGEPLTRPDFPILINEIVRHRMRFRLLTNGIRLDRQMASFLADTNRCNLVKISLDGPESFHDKGRGTGSHAAACAAIHHVREVGLPLSVCCAVHKQNFRYLEQIAHYFFEELFLPSVSFSLVLPSTCKSSEWSLTAEEMRSTVKMMGKVERKYPSFLVNRGLTRLLRNWRRMLGEPNFTDCFGGCSGLNAHFAVRADGEYIPCPALAHVELGNIRNVSIRGAWRHLAAAKISTTPLSDPICETCRFYTKCRGNCPAHRERPPHQNFGCLAQFIEHEGEECLW